MTISSWYFSNCLRFHQDFDTIQINMIMGCIKYLIEDIDNNEIVQEICWGL